MTCKDELGSGSGSSSVINLENELSNARKMAVKTDILDQVGGTIQFGKKADLFWVVMAIIVSGVLVMLSIFSKKKKR